MSSELKAHTEAAMELLRGELKELVYLPPAARRPSGRGFRLDVNGRATTHPPTEREQLQRINVADPLGFLLAVMNGQPTLTFGIRNIVVESANSKKRSKHAPARLAKAFSVLKLDEKDGQEVYAKVHTPTMEERMDAAKFLVPYVTAKKGNKKLPGADTPPDDPDTPADAPTEFESVLDARIKELEDAES